MRTLITGATGFAGRYLARACAEAGDEVIGVSRSGSLAAEIGDGRAVDLRELEAFRAVLRECRPRVIYHLAALSSVGRSWEEPATTVQDNVTTAVSVLEAIRHEAKDARIVWVSSCEFYGAPASLPVDEDAPANPANPYAVSKTTGDLLAGVYARAHGLDLVRVRPFNHAGPGQLPIFIVSSLAQQAAQARLDGLARMRIVTGNPDTRRDFTDVRDVIRAYRMLAGAERADAGAGTGAAFNVSSGRSVSAAEQVAVISELLAPIEVEHRVDPARIRGHEVMDLRGSNDRIAGAVGWHPEIPFRQTVADTIDWWERELRAASPQHRVRH